MKTIQTIAILFIVLIMTFSCKKDETPSAEIKNVDLNEKQKQLVTATNSFGFDFFKKVTEITGSSTNMMVSPLSVSMALGMVRNGASNSTLDSITDALGFNVQTDQQINESYKYIVQTFAGLDPKVKLQIANSIWYEQTYTVEEDFKQTNQTYFDASVTALDFSAPSAVEMINAWVKEKTNSLIPKIIDAIPSNAMMYVINAVYFKGQWKYQFDASNTSPKPFTLENGTNVNIEAMTQHATFDYYKGQGFEAIELPYNQGNYTMTVLLPDVGNNVSDLISQLSSENWNTWSRQFSKTDIQLQLPRFKYEYNEGNMKPILSALGMGVAFDADNADFTRINKGGGLYISRVIHKTYIETNEEGSEAAAVTAVEIGLTSAGPDQPYSFKIDRPFVYFIQEKSTGVILFIGTVMNPNL